MTSYIGSGGISHYVANLKEMILNQGDIIPSHTNAQNLVLKKSRKRNETWISDKGKDVGGVPLLTYINQNFSTTPNDLANLKIDKAKACYNDYVDNVNYICSIAILTAFLNTVAKIKPEGEDQRAEIGALTPAIQAKNQLIMSQKEIDDAPHQASLGFLRGIISNDSSKLSSSMETCNTICQLMSHVTALRI